jgi:hypothetical protein
MKPRLNNIFIWVIAIFFLFVLWGLFLNGIKDPLDAIILALNLSVIGYCGYRLWRNAHPQ